MSRRSDAMGVPDELDVYCDAGHERRALKFQVETFEDSQKVRFRCKECGRDVYVKVEKWTAMTERVKAAGSAEVSLAFIEGFMRMSA